MIRSLVRRLSVYVDRRALLQSALARKVFGLSALAALGQASFVAALPLLSRMYSPSDFGLFTIYLSVVNIGGPLVALKFDSALFAAQSRSDTLRVLTLCIVTTALTSAVILVGCLAFIPQVVGYRDMNLIFLLTIAPIGLLAAGGWSVWSAWAIRTDSMPALGTARFLQPAAMTIMQLIAGVLKPDGTSLIIAHLISHFGYSLFIMTKTLSRQDLSEITNLKSAQLLKRARDNIQFPLFVMPAQISKLAVANLPPLMIAWLFTTETVGHYGVAYRIVSAPLAIVSLALSNVFTGEASRNRNSDRVSEAALHMFLASMVFVAAPIAIFGALAPHIAGPLLGPEWVMTGRMAAAIALMGAANALAAPFSEITSIYHYQFIRFVTEVSTLALVLAPFALAAILGWNALQTIWAISWGGALGSLGNLLAVWLILRKTSALRQISPSEANQSLCLR